MPFAHKDDLCLKGGEQECRGANITVETAHLATPGRAADSTATTPPWGGDCVILARCSTGNGGSCAGHSLLVDAAAFWGASINISSSGGRNGEPTLHMCSGDLGCATVSIAGSTGKLLLGEDRSSLLASFPTGGTALAITLSFTGEHLSVASALDAVAKQRAVAENALATGGKRGGGMDEAYAAMATVIAWNVNFDPRVAVTAPVSRTFESGFDFIFFDWDMYFLSLMAGTSPAAEDTGSWAVAISNLIEVTQTRSVYGHVMNKRAASGARTSGESNVSVISGHSSLYMHGWLTGRGVHI